jgi:hypothetical protein
MTIYHIVTGPFLAYLTTSNSNEWGRCLVLIFNRLIVTIAEDPAIRSFFTCTLLVLVEISGSLIGFKTHSNAGPGLINITLNAWRESVVRLRLLAMMINGGFYAEPMI